MTQPGQSAKTNVGPESRNFSFMKKGEGVPELSDAGLAFDIEEAVLHI